MSGISKFQSYCLVICIALLLVEELGELTTFASNLPTFPYFLVGLALYCTSITFDNQTICITFTAKCGRETSWVLSETCELVVVCKGLTRNHMIKLTAQSMQTTCALIN